MMQIDPKDLVEGVNVYFLHNREIKNGIYKGLQRTARGKIVKNKNKLVERINKKGKTFNLIVYGGTKFFLSEESLKEWIKQEKELLKERIKKEEERLKIEEEETRIEQQNEYKQLIDFLSKSENANNLPMIEDVWNFMLEKFDSTDVLYLNSPINFDLKDGTNCTLTNYDGRCILHPYNSPDDFIYYIDNLIMCASCLTRLQERPDILKQYKVFYNQEYGIDETQNILLPKNWTDNGIHSWCKKRQQKEDEYDEYLERKRLRNLERDFLDNDCSICIHMRSCECEYELEEYNEDDCDFYESRY